MARDSCLARVGAGVAVGGAVGGAVGAVYGTYEAIRYKVQDWLYMDGEDATAKEFEERLDSLKAVGDPIFFRPLLAKLNVPTDIFCGSDLKSLLQDQQAVEYARKYLGEVQQIVHDWETNKPWLPKDRIDEVLKDADKFKSWLDEKENEQKKTSGFSKPAFTSEEVYDKIFNLQDKVSSIKRIPKPKPKVEKKPVKNETESSGEDGKDSNSTPEEKTSQTEKPASDSNSPSEEKTSDTAGIRWLIK
ncbi:hypothetical protein Patl1_33274 [Pistacia atlantica]|uniref:Uncharacterized protein n=1 Tax=Pistacia atlantica TaxID=434234 RepID=A0ACC1ARF3_9ROSI|nr:hypothetical protein Patl1_33274 [Pistacia atlantica]